MAGPRHPLVIFWTYSLLRIALFGVIFGLLWLFGLRGLLAAAIAIVLSVPLSFVLLSKPRAALAQSMQDRLQLRQERADDLDARLGGAGANGEAVTTEARGEPDDPDGRSAAL